MEHNTQSRTQAAPPAGTPFKFGVMTHCGTHWEPDLLRIFAEAGIRHFRDEMQWAAFEEERGVYKIPERCAKYFAEADRLGMSQLLPLTFGNPRLYDPVVATDVSSAHNIIPHWASAPYSDEGLDAYARYCAEAVAAAGPRVHAVEIWNEYNGGFAQGPADGKPEVYAEMLKRACRAIRAARPDVRIYAGDTIGIPLEWFDVVFKGSVSRPGEPISSVFDGVSVHPYGYLLTPEWQVKRLEKLRALIRKHNGGKDMPLCVSEQGWYTFGAGAHGNRAPIDEETQADYLVRAWVLFMANGVEEAYWYLGRDDEMFGTMGLLRKDYTPKPAFHAYVELVKKLEGRRFVRRIESDDPDYHCYEFEGGMRIGWDTKKSTGTTKPSRRVSYVELAGDGFVVPSPTLTPLDLTSCEYVRLTEAAVSEKPPFLAWLGWDPATLRFRAIVRDEIHCNTHHGWMGWKGDNIQLGFSTAMPWTGGEWSEPWHEFNLQLGARGPEITGIEGAQISVVRDEDAKTTTYDAALPWSELTPDGKPRDFSFAFYINENDGNGRKGFWKYGDIKCLDKMKAFKLTSKG